MEIHWQISEMIFHCGGRSSLQVESSQIYFFLSVEEPKKTDFFLHDCCTDWFKKSSEWYRVKKCACFSLFRKRLCAHSEANSRCYELVFQFLFLRIRTKPPKFNDRTIFQPDTPWLSWVMKVQTKRSCSGLKSTRTSARVFGLESDFAGFRQGQRIAKIWREMIWFWGLCSILKSILQSAKHRDWRFFLTAVSSDFTSWSKLIPSRKCFNELYQTNPSDKSKSQFSDTNVSTAFLTQMAQWHGSCKSLSQLSYAHLSTNSLVQVYQGNLSSKSLDEFASRTYSTNFLRPLSQTIPSPKSLKQLCQTKIASISVSLMQMP
jgi:hypothetical protein